MQGVLEDAGKEAGVDHVCMAHHVLVNVRKIEALLDACVGWMHEPIVAQAPRAEVLGLHAGDVNAGCAQLRAREVSSEHHFESCHHSTWVPHSR